MKRAGLEPMALSSKEGLALVSGTTSATAMAALALYDMLKAAKSADIVGAMSLEAMKGVINAFDPRVMAVRPHPDQLNASENVRRMLKGSGIMEKYRGSRVQDALSLRCIPQLHGAARKTLEDAKKTIEIEMNSCCDNPIIWPETGNEDVISACNADSAYVGMEMDSACIAAVGLAKMSERRNNRIVDGSLSGYPYFCIKNPGLNSGLMIPQYVQAGLLNEMRMLATPSTIDNTPTCGNQEDYVAMGYNACKKAGPMAEKLEYMLAIELLSVYEVTNVLRQRWIACYLLYDWTLKHADHAFYNNKCMWVEQVYKRLEGMDIDAASLGAVMTDTFNQILLEDVEDFIQTHMRVWKCGRLKVEFQVAKTIAKIFAE